MGELASGKRLHNELENHHFQWENPLFLWQFSIAMLNYQRVPRFMANAEKPSNKNGVITCCSDAIYLSP